MRQTLTLSCEKALKNSLACIKIQLSVSKTMISVSKNNLFNAPEGDRAVSLMFNEIYTSENVSYNYLLD